MAYYALYRKYRPTTFSQVIGQDHIISILKNQVRTERITHAYLFSGSRGTGKTSTARIFARAINCLSPHDGEPCGECEACKLGTSDSIDIIEMDAASNSRVDEMRALLDKAEFAPIYLKTKVYIIDEAHMLSKSAFNALLKTLEEPPAHVVFILATTEPQALPATILSRCQRFDFRRPSAAEMVGLLHRILDDVGAKVDEDGLMCIARAADGGVRDCLSLADQCLSFVGNELTRDDVLSVLGSMNTGFLFDFADAIIKSDAARVLKEIDKVISGGRDINVFVNDLSLHFRALMLAKVCGRCEDILDCTAETMEMYLEQAASTSKERLERTLNEIMLLLPSLKWTNMPRVLLENTLMKICHPDEQIEIIALSDRLSELEKMLRDGTLVVSNTEVKKTTGKETIQDVPPWEEEPARDNSPGVELPKATDEADALYKTFMAALMKTDVMLGVQMQLAAGHWCDETTLYFGFDKSRQQNYNHVSSPDVRQKLKQVAASCIAPRTVEFQYEEQAVNNVGLPTELFGTEITEED